MKLQAFMRSDGKKIAIAIDYVQAIVQHTDGFTKILMPGHEVIVSESYETTVSKLRGLE